MSAAMAACDVLVTGGGPAGAIAARTLAQAGLRVVLADSSRPAAPKIGESLPGAALALLRAQGLMPWVQRSRPACSAGNASSWGSPLLAATDFIRDPHGMGCHVDRAAFDQALRDAAADAGAHVRAAHARGAAACAGGWHVSLSDGALRAAWLVDASGRANAAGRWLDIPRLRDEPMTALYAWGRDHCDDPRSLVEAVPEGWWYTAGLPDGRRVASLQVEPALASRILRDGGEWRRRLQATLHVRRNCRVDASWSRPRGADAAGCRTLRAHGRNWLAVGDAALSMDPLSSQGIFNALYTGLRGAQAIVSACAGGNAAVPLAGYAARLDAIRAAYRRNAVHYYAVEQRWRDTPFWRRRHAAAPHLAA
jgi:flavin-dependent dehydrogenase